YALAAVDALDDVERAGIGNAHRNAGFVRGVDDRRLQITQLRTGEDRERIRIVRARGRVRPRARTVATRQYEGQRDARDAPAPRRADHSATSPRAAGLVSCV